MRAAPDRAEQAMRCDAMRCDASCEMEARQCGGRDRRMKNQGPCSISYNRRVIMSRAGCDRDSIPGEARRSGALALRPSSLVPRFVPRPSQSSARTWKHRRKRRGIVGWVPCLSHLACSLEQESEPERWVQSEPIRGQGSHEGGGEIVESVWAERTEAGTAGRCLGGMEWMDETA